MGFFLGVCVGVAGVVTLKAYYRPIVKSLIKGSLHLARKVQEAQAEVVEDLADLKAEAEADLQADQARRQGENPAN